METVGHAVPDPIAIPDRKRLIIRDQNWNHRSDLNAYFGLYF